MLHSVWVHTCQSLNHSMFLPVISYFAGQINQVTRTTIVIKNLLHYLNNACWIKQSLSHVWINGMTFILSLWLRQNIYWRKCKLEAGMDTPNRKNMYEIFVWLNKQLYFMLCNWYAKCYIQSVFGVIWILSLEIKKRCLKSNLLTLYWSICLQKLNHHI